MKSILLLFTVTSTFAQTLAQRASHPLSWSRPGPDSGKLSLVAMLVEYIMELTESPNQCDPCPMLNTLANHGYLPHDGKNISENRTIEALGKALNIDKELSQSLFEEALTTSPAANATSFSLNHLSRHNILEHDASLSRQDAYFGDNHDFNQTIFDETRSYWPQPVIDVQAAVRSRQARVNTSTATNPTYNMSEFSLAFSYFETAAYILVLGDKYSGKVNRSWVEYLFENERLPEELGWTRHNETITSDDLNTMLEKVVNATSVRLQ